MGAIKTIKFILTKEYKDKNINKRFYQDYYFDKLTNIIVNESLVWREKCADLDDFICLKIFSDNLSRQKRR